MLNKIEKYLERPELYEPGTNGIWYDNYISKNMLIAHLNPMEDNATRNPNFLNKSVDWIAYIAPPRKYNRLLDLGCGPGLYTQRFNKKGYQVTGIDYSKRSIEYAKKQNEITKSKIEFIYQDYLTIDYKDKYDVITLIWCDYGVLSTSNRLELCRKIYQSLKPGGKFILDVFSTHKSIHTKETNTWEYSPKANFYSNQANLCLYTCYLYNDDNTVLNQTIVITEKNRECYRMWEHYFTLESLLSEITSVGFSKYSVFSNVAGKEYTNNSDTIAAVFVK